jgi:hypothetical protein
VKKDCPSAVPNCYSPFELELFSCEFTLVS